MPSDVGTNIFIPTLEGSVVYGILPSGDGAFGYIQGAELLTACDDDASWVTDSAVYNAVQISLEPSIIKEGAGAIKIIVPQRPSIREYTQGGPYVSCILGKTSLGYKVVMIRFKTPVSGTLGSAKYISAIIYKIGSPANALTAHIYSDSGGNPNASLGSADVSGITTNSTWRTATLSSPLTLSNNTYYWIVFITTQDNESNYYVLQSDPAAGFTEGESRMGATVGGATAIGGDLLFKVQADSDALNKYVYDVFSAVDLSVYPNIKAWIRASRTGNQFSLCFGESNINEQSIAITISTASTYEDKTWDISAITGTSKDGITRAGLKITNVDADNTIYIDYIRGDAGLSNFQGRIDGTVYNFATSRDHPLKMAHFREEQNNGTNGGSSNNATWHIRILNSNLVNQITGCSLSSNQVILPAGSYRIRGRAPAFRSDQHRLGLFNVSDNNFQRIGPNAYSYSLAQYVVTDATVMDRFTIAANKTFELRHYITNSQANTGLGLNTASGQNEVYTEIWIEKE